MGSGFKILDLGDRCQIPQPHVGRQHVRTARGSEISRTLEHSASSFSPNTRSSCGIESFQAAFRDMMVVVTSGSILKSIVWRAALGWIPAGQQICSLHNLNDWYTFPMSLESLHTVVRQALEPLRTSMASPTNGAVALHPVAIGRTKRHHLSSKPRSLLGTLAYSTSARSLGLSTPTPAWRLQRWALGSSQIQCRRPTQERHPLRVLYLFPVVTTRSHIRPVWPTPVHFYLCPQRIFFLAPTTTTRTQLTP